MEHCGQANFEMHRKAEIGCVFTPIKWAQFFIERYELFDRWYAGASVFDPTMGVGQLLAALIQTGLERGFALDELPTNRLYGNELNTAHYDQAMTMFRDTYGLDMSKQLINSDVFDLRVFRHDIVFTNPPWCNFSDLPETYKPAMKPLFIELDLVEDKKKLLLGGARIDIAALVIQKAMRDFVKPSGHLYSFVPLSLFLNHGVHRVFRRYSVADSTFSPVEIVDLNKVSVFDSVNTRYGFVVLHKDVAFSGTVSYVRRQDHQWIQSTARPLFRSDAPLSVGSIEELQKLESAPSIWVPKQSKPRQGLNTAGRNHLFFFDSCVEYDATNAVLGGQVIVPKRYAYPLLIGKNFRGDSAPSKWVLLLHNPKTGKPYSQKQMRQSPTLWAYLQCHKQSLQSRKGTLINAYIARGAWWGLLGVGKYSFAPYKIVWEASGKNQFQPKLFAGKWQANQSMQAYIPIRSFDLAKAILKKLSESHVERYLKSMQMDRTKNWAQPGKIAQVLRFDARDSVSGATTRTDSLPAR